MPRQWYNIQPDLPKPLPPPLHPGTGKPLGPAGSGPHLSHGPDRAGGQPAALDRHPRGSPFHLQALEADAALPGQEAGGGAENPGPDLLQERKREPRGKPQTEYGHRPGLLQQEGRGQAPDHGNRRRPVGKRPCFRLQPLRAGMPGLHGQGQLPAETLPPHAHGNLGGQGHSQPEQSDRGRAEDPGQGPQFPGKPGHRHQRSGGGCGQAGRYQVFPGQRAQPRHSPSDHRGPGDQGAAEKDRRRTGYPDRVRGRGEQLCRILLSLFPGKKAGEEDPLCRRGTHRLPHPDQGALPV